jgi:septal ring factor EnvC (AmiA/AmiB activator)
MESAVLDKAPAFSIQDEVIDAMERDYMVLAVDDPSDKQQIAVVREARLEVRKARIAVENRRKELKEDALRYGQRVDAEARRIKERLEPIEAHLQFHEDAAKREAERVAREKEEQRRAVLAYRHRSLAEVGDVRPQQEYESLSDAQFDAMLDEARKAKEERDAALAREAEERRLEAERLKAEREELDRQRREQEAEQARLAAEKAKLEAEAAAVRHAEELAKARAEAAEKAAREERERIEREAAAEKARIEREAAEAKAKAERDEAERQRREAAKPDADKLLAFAEVIRGLEVPTLTEANRNNYADVRNAVESLANYVKEIGVDIAAGRL